MLVMNKKPAFRGQLLFTGEAASSLFRLEEKHADEVPLPDTNGTESFCDTFLSP